MSSDGETITRMLDEGNLAAYQWLRENTPDELDIGRLYRSALRNGHCDLADQLAAIPTAMIELEDEEISAYATSSFGCIINHVFYWYGDDYFTYLEVASHAVNTGDMGLFKRLYDLYGMTPTGHDQLMAVAAGNGGLEWLKRLGSEYSLYQTLEQAAKLGSEYVNLALDGYDSIPPIDEVVEAIMGADYETAQFLAEMYPDDIGLVTE